MVRAAGSHHTAAWIAAGVLLAGAGWLATPRPVPLFDGIGLPDQPYRYVVRPPHTPRTKPPGSARGVLAALHGVSAAGQETSPEFGPQVVLYLVEGAMSVPTEATRITVAAVPRSPGTAASDAAIQGNVYAVSAVSDIGRVRFTGKVTADITLRAPSIAGGLPVVCYRSAAGADWQDLPTQRIGRDAFRARLTGAGDYALAPRRAGPISDARPAKNSGGAGGSRKSGAGPPLVLLLAGTVAAMALIVLGLRLRTIRRRALPALVSGGGPPMTRRGHPPRRPPR